MRVIFFGTPEFAVPALRAIAASAHEVLLVVAQPDRPAGRGMHMQAPAIARTATEIGIPLEQPARIRDEAFHGRVRALAPDAGVVVAYGRILPEALLSIPRHGFINAHASLLPAWRGAAPIQRSIAAGDRETGITIMRLDAELDHGPVLLAEATPIGPDEHTPSLASRLADIGGRLLVAALDALETGTAVEVAQDHSRATLAPKIEKVEGQIDWSLPATTIYDRYRAFDPWPGISTILRGEAVRLTRIAVAKAAGHGEPGIVCGVDARGVEVETADGVVRIEEIQRAGKKAVSAFELARSWAIRPGERFGA